MGLKKREREKDSVFQKNPGEAPSTILYGDEMDYAGIQSINYRPKLTNVPTMDVPQNLNLPNLASDLSWSGRNFFLFFFFSSLILLVVKIIFF